VRDFLWINKTLSRRRITLALKKEAPQAEPLLFSVGLILNQKQSNVCNLFIGFPNKFCLKQVLTTLTCVKVSDDLYQCILYALFSKKFV
jgi:hypothetical protein